MRLSDATLEGLPEVVTRPRYDRRAISPGIVHIGVGNFFRAHGALYVEHCLHQTGQEHWGIIGMGLGEGATRERKAETIKDQNGLYTLVEFAPDGTVRARVVASMIGYLHVPFELENALALLANPLTRIVSLTITEGGYNIDEDTGAFRQNAPNVREDLAVPSRPRTVFGLIVEGLARRQSAGVGGLTILSCDNLRSNGDVAREAIVGFAGARDPALAAWIDAEVTFPNSMVDRIAPKVGPEEIARVKALTGIDDRIPVITESFSQWVLEDKFAAGRPRFQTVGVELRDDVHLFEAVKGRMLNAGHMMLAYPGLMAGFRLVHEAMAAPEIRAFVEAFLERDAMPLIKAPAGVSLADYKTSLIARFSNPAVLDQLERVASDGMSKLPVFLNKTLAQLLQQGGSFKRVALALACFEGYLAGSDRTGNPIRVVEPQLSVDDRGLLASGDPYAVLKLTPFRPLHLADSEDFLGAFTAARDHLDSAGVQAAVARAVQA